jgi:hypothetical protein
LHVAGLADFADGALSEQRSSALLHAGLHAARVVRGALRLTVIGTMMPVIALVLALMAIRIALAVIGLRRLRGRL